MFNQQLTIIDQVEIVRTRVLQVRFGIVTLDDNGREAGDGGTAYHRGIIAPGDDPDEFLATQADGMARYGYPAHPNNAQAFLNEVVTAVHTQDVLDGWKERVKQSRLDNGLKAVDPPIRETLKLAGGRQRLAAPDVAGYQHDSIIDELVITRARALLVRFGLVSIRGEREVFQRFNEGRVRPGGDVGELITQARKGLRDRGDPPLTPAAEEIITRVAAAVHTPKLAQLYRQLRDAQVLEVLRKHQESGAEGEPKIPPEISKEDALRVALAS